MNSIILLSPAEELFSVVSHYVTPLMQDQTRLQLTDRLLLSSDQKDMTKDSLLLINNDLPLQSHCLLTSRHPVITYGCHPKSTVTASSMEEKRLVCCIQRRLEWQGGYTVEPQEIPVSFHAESVSSVLGGICVLLLSFGESFFY